MLVLAPPERPDALLLPLPNKLPPGAVLFAPAKRPEDGALVVAGLLTALPNMFDAPLPLPPPKRLPLGGGPAGVVDWPIPLELLVGVERLPDEADVDLFGVLREKRGVFEGALVSGFGCPKLAKALLDGVPVLFPKLKVGGPLVPDACEVLLKPNRPPPLDVFEGFCDGSDISAVARLVRCSNVDV